MFTKYWDLSDCNYLFFRSLVRCIAICFSSVSTGSRLSETVAATAGHHCNFCRLVIKENCTSRCDKWLSLRGYCVCANILLLVLIAHLFKSEIY